MEICNKKNCTFPESITGKNRGFFQSVIYCEICGLFIHKTVIFSNSSWQKIMNFTNGSQKKVAIFLNQSLQINHEIHQWLLIKITKFFTHCETHKFQLSATSKDHKFHHSDIEKYLEIQQLAFDKNCKFCQSFAVLQKM